MDKPVTPNYTNYESPECLYYGTSNLIPRFWLVLVFGTIICIVALIENLFMGYLLFFKSTFSNSPLLYLAVLSVFDVFLSFTWILVQSVPVLYDYLEYVPLYYAWIHYSKPVYAFTLIIITASAYLIIFASLENYLKTRYGLKFQHPRRGWISLLAVFIGTVVQCTSFWEIEIIYHPECTGFEAYVVAHGKVFSDPLMNTIWTFYFRNIMDVFLPFFILLYLNSAIMITLKNRHQQENNRNEIVKDATRELISEVLEYLVSNVMNVILAFWETFALELLMTEFADFYDFGSDFANILTVFCRTLRLPIYCYCNSEIRSETMILLKKLCGCFFCEKEKVIFGPKLKPEWV